VYNYHRSDQSGLPRDRSCLEVQFSRTESTRRLLIVLGRDAECAFWGLYVSNWRFQINGLFVGEVDSVTFCLLSPPAAIHGASSTADVTKLAADLNHRPPRHPARQQTQTDHPMPKPGHSMLANRALSATRSRDSRSCVGHKCGKGFSMFTRAILAQLSPSGNAPQAIPSACRTPDCTR
jgi:hypothetical protein